jgi:hypothetical protein
LKYTVFMYSNDRRAIRVLHLRVKDKHAAWLSNLAREVNFVFNYCNDLSIKVFEREPGRSWNKRVAVQCLQSDP